MPRRPNILIVMTDHQRGDTVLPGGGCHLPNVQRLARDGVTFTEAFCPTPHCCPARATFHTGQYPSVHGVWNNICNGQRLSAGVHPEVRMWSQDLRAAGYDLHYTGKWHVSTLEDPKDRGWTEHGPSSNKGHLHGQRWDHWQTLAAQPDPVARGPGQILRPGWGPYTMYAENESFPHDEAATRHALDTLAAVKDSDKPWCLFVGLIGPHDPYLAPRRHLESYRLEDIALPRSYDGDRMRDKPGLYQRMRDQIWGQLTPDEVREGIRHFRAYCSYLDELFGRMLDGLDATGQAEDTLVLYTADHGDYCGDHGLFCKSIPCFRGAYHVPAVMRWPSGLQRPGRREDAFVSLADFAPTFLELAGIPASYPVAGRSLAPFLRGETPAAWRDTLHTQCNGVEVYATQRSVMTKAHKYVYNAFDRDELYDLARDPDEMVNVADQPEYAEVKRRLTGEMWRFAYANNDQATNAYITIALAPYGPAEAFRPPAAPG